MTPDDDGRGRATPMADGAAGEPRGRDLVAGDARRAPGLPAGPVHAERARDAGAPLGGRAAAGRGAAVPGSGAANRRVDDDGDARGALAEARRAGLPGGARAAEAAGEV